MTKRPRPEAISYIPLAAGKEVVVNEELKISSVNAPFHCAYHHAFQNSRKPTSVTKLNSNTIRSSNMLTFIERCFRNSNLQCGEFRVPNYCVHLLCCNTCPYKETVYKSRTQT